METAGASAIQQPMAANREGALTPQPTRRTCVYCGSRVVCEQTEITVGKAKMIVWATKCKNKGCMGHLEDSSGICCDVCGFFGGTYSLDKKKFLCGPACAAAHSHLA